MEKTYKRIAEFISGNVIGIVEEPDPVDPSVPLEEQRMVKIGVLDQNQPLPKEDAEKVIQQLREFVTRVNP
jgi:hypothetical protein